MKDLKMLFTFVFDLVIQLISIDCVKRESGENPEQCPLL